MFQAEDDGKCPDQACRRPLAEKDYILGFCPRCDGALPVRLLKVQPTPEKIEKLRKLEENSEKLSVKL